MKRRATRLDYAARIARVLAYMDAHLDRDLSTARLAEVACFSPYHFHRIFRSVTGETVEEAARRMRLHAAAVALARGTEPIARIARRAGYGSLAAFGRAFAATYGLPPAAFRRRGVAMSSPIRAILEDDTMQDPVIETMPPLRLAAIPHAGAYDKIGGAFDRLYAWAGPRGLIGPQTRSIGVYLDDPESVPAAKLRSYAGMSVDASFVAEGEIEIVEIPGGEVACLVHMGPYAELEPVYRALYKGWLPTSGREPADAPSFEEYLNDPRTLPPTEWLTKVCVPLRPVSDG